MKISLDVDLELQKEFNSKMDANPTLPNKMTQFQLKTHSKHRTDNILSFQDEKRKRQTWINKLTLKCYVLLCTYTNSYSTESYPSIKINQNTSLTNTYSSVQKGSILYLIDHHTPLNINYSQQHF